MSSNIDAALARGRHAPHLQTPPFSNRINKTFRSFCVSSTQSREKHSFTLNFYKTPYFHLDVEDVLEVLSQVILDPQLSFRSSLKNYHVLL